MIVDAVFVIGTGSKNNNEELRYALRNIERHCPFIRDVYIVGECPTWVDTSKVKHIQWGDRFTHAKDANIIDKLRVACEQPDIADNILFCSDDQFQTRVCTWEDFEPRWLRHFNTADEWYLAKKRIWHTRLKKTLDRELQRRKHLGLDTSTIYYYQPHIWMPIQKTKFLEYAKWSEYETREDTIIASGYFNFINAGGKYNFDHIFTSPEQKWDAVSTHVAYSDASFNAAMTYLKNIFYTKSKYEKAEAQNKEEAFNPESPFTRTKYSEVQMTELLHTVWYEPAWSAIKKEMMTADILRRVKYPGWHIVWNDIIYRWNKDTENGHLILPVTSPCHKEAIAVLDRCLQEKPFLLQNYPDNIQLPSQPDTSTKEDLPVEKGSPPSALPTEINEVTPTTAVIPGPSAAPCLTCAIEHLGTAVAYLNSDAARPSMTDIVLAKGELRVASLYLLALDRQEEYNKCIQILDNSEKESNFLTGANLKEIITQLITI